MNTTPDPEETEREALPTRAEKTIKGLRYWGRAANNPAIRVDSSSGASVIEELLAARRLSESEIRRDQAERDAAIISGIFPDPHEPEDNCPDCIMVETAALAIRAQFATPSPETEQGTE